MKKEFKAWSIIDENKDIVDMKEQSLLIYKTRREAREQVSIFKQVGFEGDKVVKCVITIEK